MITRLTLPATALFFLALGVHPAPASSQLPIDVEAGSFVRGALLLSDQGPIDISRQGAAPIVISDGEVHNGIALGVTAGLRFADRLGVEGMYAWIPGLVTSPQGLAEHGGSVDLNSIRYAGSALYHFTNQSRLQPFVGLGFGGETVTWGNRLAWERQTRTAPFLALGGSIRLDDDVSLRVRATRDLTSSSRRALTNQLMLTVGLNLRERVRQ